MNEDFEIETGKINLIYFKARQSFEIYKYFSKQDFISDPFWVHIMYLSFKDTIIELDKLFSENKNQKFRIRKLLNKLKKTGQYKNCNLNKRAIEEWENEMLQFTPVIKYISELRDKHFAHTDKSDSLGLNTSSVYYRNILNNSEIETLFDFIKKVMVEIFIKCKKEQLELDLFFYESNISIFKQLNDLSTYRETELNQKLKEYKKDSV
jgi:hypothetical protein